VAQNQSSMLNDKSLATQTGLNIQ